MGPAFCSSYRTTFSGAPSSHAARFSKTITARFSSASFVANATCGVATRLGAEKSGWSRGMGGSVSKTSIPAPAITPSDSAFASAALSTTGRAPC